MANGLRICCLHCSGSGHRCGMGLIPGLGLLHAAGAAKKKRKKEKEKGKEERKEKGKLCYNKSFCYFAFSQGSHIITLIKKR